MPTLIGSPSSGSSGSAWAEQRTSSPAGTACADGKPPSAAPRRAALEPAGPRRTDRGVAPERQRHRDRQVRPVAPARLSHRRAVRPADRGHLRLAVEPQLQSHLITTGTGNLCMRTFALILAACAAPVLA